MVKPSEFQEYQELAKSMGLDPSIVNHLYSNKVATPEIKPIPDKLVSPLVLVAKTNLQMPRSREDDKIIIPRSLYYFKQDFGCLISFCGYKKLGDLENAINEEVKKVAEKKGPNSSRVQSYQLNENDFLGLQYCKSYIFNGAKQSRWIRIGKHEVLPSPLTKKVCEAFDYIIGPDSGTLRRGMHLQNRPAFPLTVLNSKDPIYPYTKAIIDYGKTISK